MPEEKKKNLLIADAIKRDMVGYSPKIREEIRVFLNKLSDNPNTVTIVPKPVEVSKDHFYHRLPSGCLVFWELLHHVPMWLSIRSQDGEIIRILGVGFNFPKGFQEHTL
jgi:hypothetical protein